MEDKTSFESQLSDKQFPLVRLEFMVDELTNLLGGVQDEMFKGASPREYLQLRRVYFNVLIRTKSLRGDEKRFNITRSDKPVDVIGKIEEYLSFLQVKGIYSLGKEDFSL